MIRIHGIKLNISKDQDRLRETAAGKLHISADDIEIVRIARMSLDAREKPVLYRVFSLDIKSSKSDEWLIKACKKAGLQYSVEKTESFSITPLRQNAEDTLNTAASKSLDHRPVIAGFGPCGMFAALALAEYGLRPVVLERGSRMEDRISAVESFWNGGPLDPECNVQFGEGGAGTFSDGKLTTGTRSPYAQWILEQFAAAGASPEILYLQKPHIGTDVLRKVVVNIRERIASLGGELLFDCRLEELITDGGRLHAVSVRNKAGESFGIKTDTVVLALGHSARDTIRTLFGQGLPMEQKPFSIGVRIEHPQAMIDMAQYGALHEELCIGAADYKLNVRTLSGRGVYTFCMCPGGYVINSSSFPGMLTTNGMSNSDRSSGTANSALLADVMPSDYAAEYLPAGTDPSHPLAGIAFQEKYEHLAFELGGSDHCAPVQTVGDFLNSTQQACEADKTHDPSSASEGSAEKTAVSPSFRPGTKKADLHGCLPDFAAEAIAEALPLLGKKLRGFDSPDALMTAVESRSSSPVRIKRDPETLQTVISGVYPAGEGAGYAGGIMSAAADGVRIAVKIAENR